MITTTLLSALLSFLVHIKSASSQDFEFLVFGGTHTEKFAELYNIESEIPLRILPKFPTAFEFKPYASFIDGNLTICSGGPPTCFYLEQENQKEWKGSFQLFKWSSASTRTFDNKIWSFFGGSPNPAKSLILQDGQVSEINLGISLGDRPCSIRFNQTHSIISTKSGQTFWFIDNQNALLQWTLNGEEHENEAACGLVHSNDTGFQFVVAGKKKGKTESFSFDENAWLELQNLPEQRSRAAYLQFQNSFLAIGGKCEDGFCKNAVKFDFESGWQELQMKLKQSYTEHGVLHVDSAHKLKSGTSHFSK